MLLPPTQKAKVPIWRNRLEGSGPDVNIFGPSSAHSQKVEFSTVCVNSYDSWIVFEQAIKAIDELHETRNRAAESVDNK